MKIKTIEEEKFLKKFNRALLIARSLISFKPFELVVIKEGLSKLGIGVDYLIFTNELLEPNTKLINFPFSSKRAYFKHALIKLEEMFKYLKESEHKELSRRISIKKSKKERVSMTIGHVITIYPPLYRLFNRKRITDSIHFNEIIV